MPPIRPAFIAATLLAAVLSCAAAQAGPPGSTVIISRPAGFGALTAPVVNDSFTSALLGVAASANGFIASPGSRLVGGPSNSSRYHVFVSLADGMSPDDSNAVANVYLRDVVANTTTLVSKASDGTPANGDSFSPAISADGRYVAFVSTATNLVPNVDPNGTEQVYERDLLNGTTILISRADGAAGVIGNDYSNEPSVATSGAVAFTSRSSNLGDPTGHEQVYVRAGSNTTLESVKNTTTTPGSNDSFGPSLSDDGSHLAFTSQAADILATDTNGTNDVFVRNLSTHNTVLGSVKVGGSFSNGDSSGASLSADGHRLAFTSVSTDMAPADPNNNPDVYVRDFNTSTTTLISQGGVSTAVGNAGSFDASIAADGGKVAFLSNATNFYSGDTNGVTDVYTNTVGGGATLASRCQAAALLTLPASQAAIAPSGGEVSFTTASRGCAAQADDDFSQVYTRLLGIILAGTEPTTWISRPTGTADFKSGTNDSAIAGLSRAGNTNSALSADGAVAVFVSDSDELSPDDDNAVPNVYVRENRTGVTELISRASGASGAAGNGPSGPDVHGLRTVALGNPSISADGRYVAFASAADNLVPGDTNGVTDIFVRDRVAQTTTLVSVKTDGSHSDADSYTPSISADGTKVAFASDAVLDPVHDTAGHTSVYVRDLVAGTTTLASRQSVPGVADANADASNPAISGDGTHVAFFTGATNLAAAGADTNAQPDVYVRDLAAQQTQLGSTRDGVLPVVAGDKGASSGVLDFTGTHLAFASTSTNLVGAADGNGTSDVFLRTLNSTSTVLVSQGTLGFAGNRSSASPSISADGNRIAFATGATDLTSDDTTTNSKVVLRDLVAGTTILVSRADGAAGALPDAFSNAPSISPGGHCVAFDSQADNLVAGPAGTDFVHAFERAIDADCGTPPAPPAPPGGGGGGGPALDTTAPVVSALKLSPATFRVGAKATAISARKRAPQGTKIRFSLSEVAKVSLRIELVRKGRRKGSRCVAGRSTGKRCTRYVRKGTLARSGRTGANTVRFSGRIGKRKLARGRYRLTVTATDAAGNRSAKKTATFRIV